MASMMNTEVIVDMDLGNLNLLSINVAAGRNSIAIKKARKKGAKILCPSARRYPRPIMEITTSVRLTRKGSLRKFIFFSNLLYKNKKTLPFERCFWLN
jgi:hypothetical protein